jgi:hypothetical protein
MKKWKGKVESTHLSCKSLGLGSDEMGDLAMEILCQPLP